MFVVSDSGISLGWGWDREVAYGRDNHVTGNLIHHILLKLWDGGFLYTIGVQSLPHQVPSQLSLATAVRQLLICRVLRLCRLLLACRGNRQPAELNREWELRL